jgi:hypothetical protein
MAIAPLTCRKPRTQLSGNSTFCSNRPPSTFGFHLKTLCAHPQPRLAAGTQFIQCSPKPGREINIGRAGDNFAFRREHFRISDDHCIDTLILAERLEENPVRVNRDDRIENPAHHFALCKPGVV